jgi:mutator family transposase
MEPRRRSEQALVSAVQEAYVAGVSTRKVDQVVESLGLRISKSEVSRICQGLDERAQGSQGGRIGSAIDDLHHSAGDPFSIRTSANGQSMASGGEPDDLIPTGPEIAIPIRAPDAFAVAGPVCRNGR